MYTRTRALLCCFEFNICIKDVHLSGPHLMYNTLVLDQSAMSRPESSTPIDKNYSSECADKIPSTEKRLIPEFCILYVKDPMDPAKTVIVIRSLVPEGVAELDGRLLPGDRLMYVNSMNLESACLEEAVQALKGASLGTVHIGVAKPLPVRYKCTFMTMCVCVCACFFPLQKPMLQ